MKWSFGRSNTSRLESEKALYEFLGGLRSYRCHIKIEHKDLGKFELRMIDTVDTSPIPELETPAIPDGRPIKGQKEAMVPLAHDEAPELKDFEAHVLNEQFPEEQEIPHNKED